MEITGKQHWENIYSTKLPDEVSWTQAKPETSLRLIREFNLPKSATIIDAGGGDSHLVDFLLAEGYENVTVLDISEKALERAQLRLGEKASSVNWIATDIVNFKPEQTYDIWHDRAAFHFLTEADQVNQYLNIARNAVNSYMIIGTFSNNGPLKCSGLTIQQYSESQMEQTFAAQGFEKTHCFTETHTTPFNTTQDFLFCSFKKVSL
jgi:hypothetical protein